MQKNLVYTNERIISAFDDDEKNELFKDIADMYFKRNFGSLSKADLETYLFSFYIEHLLNHEEEFDDYTIGRDLGLTISRVRSLKERKELKYPHSGYDWRDEFLNYAKNARYDDTRKLIKFSIPDVNVIKDARNFFEKNDEYVEYQLNPKLFQCSLEAFQKMGEMLAKKKGEAFEIQYDKEKIEKIYKSDKCSDKEKHAVQKILNDAVVDGMKDLLAEGAKEIILEILKCLTPSAGVASSIIEIIKNAISR